MLPLLIIYYLDINYFMVTYLLISPYLGMGFYMLH